MAEAKYVGYAEDGMTVTVELTISNEEMGAAATMMDLCRRVIIQGLRTRKIDAAYGDDLNTVNAIFGAIAQSIPEDAAKAADAARAATERVAALKQSAQSNKDKP